MPVRRANNGGWERVSAAQIELEGEADHHDPHQQGETNDDGDDDHHPPQQAGLVLTEDSMRSTSSWALEGARRIREKQVHRKMQYLTGMAAIGGFLFGYDTGTFGCFPFVCDRLCSAWTRMPSYSTYYSIQSKPYIQG
jgi:hypothetical protein